MQGTAIIYRRSLEASDDHELWVLTDFQINSTLLDFEEPVTLLPISQGRGKLLEAVDSDLGEGDRRLEPDTAVIEEADGESIDEEESSSWENSDTQPKEVVSEKEKIIEEGSLKDSDEIVQMKKGNKEKEGDDEKEKDSSLAGENSHSNDDTKPVEINVKKTDVEEETRSHPEKSSQPATQGNSVKEVDDTIEEENVDSDNTENNPGAVNPVTE